MTMKKKNIFKAIKPRRLRWQDRIEILTVKSKERDLRRRLEDSITMSFKEI